MKVIVEISCTGCFTRKSKSCYFSHNYLYPHFISSTDSSVSLILNGPHQGKSGTCSNFFLYFLRSAIFQLFIYLFPALGKK